MMYVNKLAWHGLGTALKDPLTSWEAIHTVGLDAHQISVVRLVC
jgi:hypothetical protein